MHSVGPFVKVLLSSINLICFHVIPAFPHFMSYEKREGKYLALTKTPEIRTQHILNLMKYEHDLGKLPENYISLPTKKVKNEK